MVKTAVSRLAVAKEQLEKTQEEYKKEEKNQLKLEELKEQLFRLQDALPKVKDLTAKKAELTQLNEANELNQAQLSSIMTQLEAQRNKVEKHTQEIEEKEQAILSLDEKLDLLRQLNEQCKLIDDYVMLQKQTKTYVEKEGEQERLFKEAQEKYDQFTNEWILGEAFVLAAELHDGEACPVCGSLEHPNKAHETNTNVSKEQLEQEKGRLVKVESDYRTTAAQTQAAQKQLEKQEQLVARAAINVTEIEAEKDRVLKEQKAVEQKVTELRNTREQLIEDKKALAKQTNKVTSLAEQQSTIEKTVYETKASIQTIEALIQQITETVPKDLIALPILEQRINDLGQQKNEMEYAWKKVQQQLEAHRELVTTSTSNEKHAQAVLMDIGGKKNKRKVGLMKH